MKVAQIDIAHKSFHRKLNGLDPHEVYDFLRDIADQMEEIIRERNHLKEQLREKELAIMEYRERDETLKATITTATRMAEQMRGDAEKEAHLILQDAHQKSDVIIRDARDSLKKMYQEIADLKKARMQFESHLRSVLQAHLSMLDQGRIYLRDPVNAPAEAAPAPAHQPVANPAVNSAAKPAEAGGRPFQKSPTQNLMMK